jgi:hypothetical protein
MLAMAIPLHLGIGICLGMMTFGLVMLIGCLAFVPSTLVRAAVDAMIFRKPRPGVLEPPVQAPATRDARQQRPPKKRAHKLS